MLLNLKVKVVNELVLTIRKETGDNRFGGNIKAKAHDGEFLDLENLLKELIERKLRSTLTK